LQRFCSTAGDLVDVESLPLIRDSGEALVDVRTSAPLRVAGTVLLRHGLVDRLVTAQSLLPRALRLLLVDGHHPLTCPCPHTTGGAVDLTLSDEDSSERDTTPLPACCTDPTPLPREKTWKPLSTALSCAGLVNHPARWWHWSYGDRFWASATRASHARYGPAFPES